MNTKSKFFLGLAIVVLGSILALGLVLLKPFDKKQAPQPTESTLYDSFDIPTTPIPYPSGWPQDLRYPQPLELVHAIGNAEAGWEAAIIYDGTAKEASDIIENFFANNGWTITEHADVDENNLGFFISRNDSQGFVIIGSDPSSSNIVKITITVHD